jgi:hypothetical protein
MYGWLVALRELCAAGAAPSWMDLLVEEEGRAKSAAPFIKADEGLLGAGRDARNGAAGSLPPSWPWMWSS